MTDLYIETPTQADYDALTRLAESAGFEWASGNKMSEEPNNYLDERGETVIHLDTRLHRLWYDNQRHYEDKTIETIPNLSDIKAIWKVQPDDHKAFFKGKSYKHPLPSDKSIIMLEMADELAEGLMDIYKALAVEYKPQESEEAMNEKVKLPRNVIDTFRPELDSPGHRISLIDMRIISAMYNRTLKGITSDVANWLNDYENQWKLIDALHYGYEAEPEPRWGIRAGNCYMDNTIEWSFETVINPYAIFDEFDYFTNKAEADDLVKTLGFGEVVDLNKETKADE